MKNFKKGEVAIYAIALMLVAAGYFNYSTFEQKTVETYAEDVSQIDEQSANVGDAVLVSNNEVENTQNETQNMAVDTNTVTNDITTDTNTVTNDITTDSNTTTDNTTVDTNATTNDVTDYYAGSKLDRDKMYAEMISNYETILNNTNASEAQKSIATQEITKINNTKNAIMIAENLILTKGFENCVIFVNEESVNIVVSVERRINHRWCGKNSKYNNKRIRN